MSRQVRKSYDSPQAAMLANWGANHMRNIERNTYGDPDTDKVIKDILCNLHYPGFRMFRTATGNVVRVTTTPTVTTPSISGVMFYVGLDAYTVVDGAEVPAGLMVLAPMI